MMHGVENIYAVYLRKIEMIKKFVSKMSERAFAESCCFIPSQQLGSGVTRHFLMRKNHECLLPGKRIFNAENL